MPDLLIRKADVEEALKSSTIPFVGVAMAPAPEGTQTDDANTWARYRLVDDSIMANDRIRTLQRLNDDLRCEVESMACLISEAQTETEQAEARAERLQRSLIDLAPIIEAARSWDVLRTDRAELELLHRVSDVTRWPKLTAL